MGVQDHVSRTALKIKPLVFTKRCILKSAIKLLHQRFYFGLHNFKHCEEKYQKAKDFKDFFEFSKKA